MIKNRQAASQIQDFSGLPIGATNIDGLIEYHDKCFIFIEAKYGNSEMKYGQKLALERLCDACQDAGKESLVIICRHDTKEGDIDFANTRVTEVRYKYKWTRVNMTTAEAIESFLKHIKEEYE